MNELWIQKEFQNAYRENNYKILDFNNKSSVCLLLISSNGLYYPNTISEFKKIIIEGDQYEWENLCRTEKITQYAHRIIYIRDIYKQWYVNGINTRLNNITILSNEMKLLTKGYDIVVAGGSSGGYAAVLLGLLLDAKRIYSFSGQFTLTDEIEKNPLLNQYKKDDSYSQFYNTIEWIKRKSEIPIFYFYPAYAKQDVKQYMQIKKLSNIYAFPFAYCEHAQTMLGISKRDMLISDTDVMRQLHHRCKNIILTKWKFLDLYWQVLNSK